MAVVTGTIVEDFDVVEDIGTGDISTPRYSSINRLNTYTWNARNQLTQISQGGSPQLSFTYDALGRRVGKTVQGTATQFLYDGNNAVQETQGGTINPILVGLHVDERFARNDVTGRTYFLTDLLNSTIALTDATGGSSNGITMTLMGMSRRAIRRRASPIRTNTQEGKRTLLASITTARATTAR